MRSGAVDAFTFHSARDLKQGINLGVINAKAFAQKKPNDNSFQTWECTATTNQVEFVQSSSNRNEAFIFPIQNFLINGKLPFPAN